MLIAGITSTITDWIAHNGAYAVFVLMAIDALLPVGGELVMLYAGVIAAGAVHHTVSLFGASLAHGAATYVALSLAGTLGYLLGACVGWELGRRGGRALIARHGRFMHLGESRMVRAERWFERWGRPAVLLGRLTPVVRSFISIPAGVLSISLAPYVVLTAIGSALWCFGFAAAGWALGGSWHSFHDGFRYADYVAVAAALGVVALLVLRAVRPSRRGRSAAAMPDNADS